jgi:hypothetical protein
MTSDFCAMEPPPRTERLLPRRASAGSTCEVIQAGAIPNRMPVRIEMTNVNSKTGPDGEALTGT